jgi:hypothetical protein
MNNPFLRPVYGRKLSLLLLPQRRDKSRYGRADDTLGTPQIEANKQPVQGVSLYTEYQSFMSLSGLDFFHSVSTKYTAVRLL